VGGQGKEACGDHLDRCHPTGPRQASENGRAPRGFAPICQFAGRLSRSDRLAVMLRGYDLTGPPVPAGPCFTGDVNPWILVGKRGMQAGFDVDISLKGKDDGYFGTGQSHLVH
jgi:hypothetical protein